MHDYFLKLHTSPRHKCVVQICSIQVVNNDTFWCVIVIHFLLTITAEVAVFVVNPLGVPGDLFDLTVFTQARHIVVFFELVSAVHAAHENQLVLHTQS